MKFIDHLVKFLLAVAFIGISYGGAILIAYYVSEAFPGY